MPSEKRHVSTLKHAQDADGDEQAGQRASARRGATPQDVWARVRAEEQLLDVVAGRALAHAPEEPREREDSAGRVSGAPRCVHGVHSGGAARP